MKALAAHLALPHSEGRLNCPRAEIAAWQFVGLVQEFRVWPKVMDIGEAGNATPSVDVVIEEAIATCVAGHRPV
jgi:TetR/AcrR family transcriptional regulator, regulator of autoinduction and epiphytic fitness